MAEQRSCKAKVTSSILVSGSNTSTICSISRRRRRRQRRG
jgi:hypothetical protein